MKYYKITNITNMLPPKDVNFNSTILIEYPNSIFKESRKLRPDETIYLSINKLPISIDTLRMKNLITVDLIPKEILSNFKKKNKIIENKLVKSKPKTSEKPKLTESSKQIEKNKPKKQIEKKEE